MSDTILHQAWKCSRCGKSGTVYLKAGNPPIAVIMMIIDDHIQASPSCPGGVEDIRAEV